MGGSVIQVVMRAVPNRIVCTRNEVRAEAMLRKWGSRRWLAGRDSNISILQCLGGWESPSLWIPSHANLPPPRALRGRSSNLPLRLLRIVPLSPESTQYLISDLEIEFRIPIRLGAFREVTKASGKAQAGMPVPLIAGEVAVGPAACGDAQGAAERSGVAQRNAERAGSIPLQSLRSAPGVAVGEPAVSEYLAGILVHLPDPQLQRFVEHRALGVLLVPNYPLL